MDSTTLEIKQGSTHNVVFRWESALYSYKPITAISKAAPAVITATSHGIPNGWFAWVTGCKGMTEINVANDSPLRTNERRKVTVVDVNSVSLNDTNSTNYGTYTTGGVLAWKTPNDLANYTARMQIRDSVESDTILATYETNPAPGGGVGNGRIALDNTAKTITLTIPASETEAFTDAFDGAAWDLEMVASGGTVTRIAMGRIKLSKEVTR